MPATHRLAAPALLGGLLTAAACAPVGPLPAGSVALHADGVEGFVEVVPAAGCEPGRARVGLWGDRWGTPGVVTATVEEPEPGLLWLTFPLETGLGEGEGALRLQGGQAWVPLGGRPGEHDATLRVTPAAPPADGGAAWDRAFRERIRAEQDAWAVGTFRLEDHGALVGEVQLRGEEPPWVRVYDQSWWTANPTLADLGSDGGDLLLAFDVEPRLEEERALLRVNVARRSVVVPQDTHPTPDDRRLDLVPGTTPPDEREARMEWARRAAAAAESAWVAESLPALAAAAARPGGDCATLETLDPIWGLLLRGYAVEISAEGGRCVVGIEPEIAQHNRRWQGRVGPEGVLDGGLLPSD